MCKSHYMEAKRHITSEEYIPKWKRNITFEKKCSYPDCMTPCDEVSTPSFTDKHQVETILQFRVQDEEKVFLCKSHYQYVYCTMRKEAALPCATCSATPIAGTMFNRHCPNPHVISEHMNFSMGTDVTISASDVICSTCYKTHLQIINKSENESHDCDLKALIEQLQSRIDVTTNKAMKTILNVAIYVAGELLLQRALLLPKVSKAFLNEYGHNNIESDLQTLKIETDDAIIRYTSRWLLNSLTTKFFQRKKKCMQKKKKNQDTLRDSNLRPRE